MEILVTEIILNQIVVELHFIINLHNQIYVLVWTLCILDLMKLLILVIHMFILKLAGKILLLPVWMILFVIGLAVKMTVQTYAVVRGILGFLFTLLIIATAYCYHDWVQVAFLFVLSTILYLILFAGVVVDTVLDMTRESIIDFILS